jgi:hypothetical protein
MGGLAGGDEWVESRAENWVMTVRVFTGDNGVSACGQESEFEVEGRATFEPVLLFRRRSVKSGDCRQLIRLSEGDNKGDTCRGSWRREGVWGRNMEKVMNTG